MKFKINDKVKIIEKPYYYVCDEKEYDRKLKKGEVCTVLEERDGDGDYLLKNKNSMHHYVNESCLELAEKSIRDCKIGDVIIMSGENEVEILDVGKNGFVSKTGTYWSFESLEQWYWKIKPTFSWWF